MGDGIRERKKIKEGNMEEVTVCSGNERGRTGWEKETEAEKKGRKNFKHPG